MVSSVLENMIPQQETPEPRKETPWLHLERIPEDPMKTKVQDLDDSCACRIQDRGATCDLERLFLHYL